MKMLNSNLNLNEFFRTLHGKESLLMLDYDGTLAPFAKDRMHAHPYPGVKDLLSALLELKKCRTVIVSGRRLKELEVLIDIPLNLELWGSHGLERKLSNGLKMYTPISSKRRIGLEKGINICKENIKADYCEVKPYAVAIHWRGLEEKEKAQMIRQVEPWNQICKDYDFEIHPFDGGVELRPRGRNKGDVVRELFNEIASNTIIAYLGDDLTDEEAFGILGQRGLKVLVRKEWYPTLADVQLIPPKELLTFLDRWRRSNE
jgi:trehalose 6-phosphate phosphatase